MTDPHHGRPARLLPQKITDRVAPPMNFLRTCRAAATNRRLRLEHRRRRRATRCRRQSPASGTAEWRLAAIVPPPHSLTKQQTSADRLAGAEVAEGAWPFRPTIVA